MSYALNICAAARDGIGPSLIISRSGTWPVSNAGPVKARVASRNCLRRSWLDSHRQLRDRSHIGTLSLLGSHGNSKDGTPAQPNERAGIAIIGPRGFVNIPKAPGDGYAHPCCSRYALFFLVCET